MIDPTSSVGEIDPEDAPTCEVCGELILDELTHRVITWIDDENQVQHRHFCSDQCRDSFEEPAES